MMISTSDLSRYHPVVVEGMSSYDPRDPTSIALNVHQALQQHWKQKPTKKPLLVMSQGDPVSERGIAPINSKVANLLNASRGLICLDTELVPYHSPNADRTNVILELWYSQLTKSLDSKYSEQQGNSESGDSCAVKSVVKALENTIDQHMQDKNDKRRLLGKPPLKASFKDYAMLQEVTKAACFALCGEITIAHTAKNISEFSVTSFYRAGLERGLVQQDDMVFYPWDDDLDFEEIDKR